MQPSSSAIRPSLPRDLLPVALVCAAFLAFAAWSQSYWWITLEESHFGWLTPAFALFVLYDRRERIYAAWTACGAANPTPSARGRLTARILGVLASFLFGFGLLVFLAGAVNRAGVGPSMKGTFMVSLGAGAVVLSLPWLAAPRTKPGMTEATGNPRIHLCGLLIFPALVWLLSEPRLSVFESQMSLYALKPMAALVAFLFNMLGCPIVHEGNVLIMPDQGRVGVEEACSGIRSFSACVFAGCFLGAVFLRRFSRKVLLIVAATVIAFILNFGRSLFLAGWAYAHGAGSIEGTVHDTAGYVVMALTTACLLGLLRLFSQPADKSR